MALKYGDAVVLVRKSRDVDGKDSISRVNAIVLASATQPPNANRRGALKNHKGVLPHGEYLDLAFPTELPEGQLLTSRSADHIFRFAYAVPEWDGDGNIGWERAADREQFNAAYGALASENDYLRKDRNEAHELVHTLRAELAAAQRPTEPQGAAEPPVE
jgi:hypothetical protein